MLAGFRFRKLEEKGQAGRPRYGWEDSVTMDHKEARCDVGEICALLGYYAASTDNPLLTFRDSVSVPSSRVNKSKNMGQIRCTETSVKDYHSTLCNIPEECRSQVVGCCENTNELSGINITL